jgi:ElaB/YqjD/DUF883 family membrane-anchored ribosome-binding protein
VRVRASQAIQSDSRINLLLIAQMCAPAARTQNARANRPKRTESADAHDARSVVAQSFLHLRKFGDREEEAPWPLISCRSSCRATHMNPNPSSGQTSRSTSSHVEPEHVGPSPLNEDVTKLQREVASLKDTFARLASQVSGEAAKTVRNVSQTVASQAGTVAGGVADAGSELASSAKEHAKTVVSELEAMARRNPLGTIAGAVLVGVIIGMISMSRGRS